MSWRLGVVGGCVGDSMCMRGITTARWVRNMTRPCFIEVTGWTLERLSNYDARLKRLNPGRAQQEWNSIINELLDFHYNVLGVEEK